MSADQKYRITHDVLIARTAKRSGVTVVTDNTKDFEAIQNFCNVRLMTGDDYFSG
jgi:predicted nucleic acid-binding protein